MTTKRNSSFFNESLTVLGSIVSEIDLNDDKGIANEMELVL